MAQRAGLQTRDAHSGKPWFIAIFNAHFIAHELNGYNEDEKIFLLGVWAL